MKKPILASNTVVVPIKCQQIKLSEETYLYNSVHTSYHHTEQYINNNNNIETCYEGIRWFGIFLAFISGIFFLISLALVKGIKNVEFMILLSIQSIIQLILMLVTACIKLRNLMGPKNHRLIIQFQGLVGGIIFPLLYYSLRKLSLEDVTSIIFSSPFIIITLFSLYLKETCGVSRVTVIWALFAGIILVIQPHPCLFQIHKNIDFDVTSYVYVLLAAFFTAIHIVIIRKCPEIHYSVTGFNLAVWSLIFASIFFVFMPMDEPMNHFSDRLFFPNDWFTWKLIIMIIITGMVGQILVTNALKIEGADKVSVARSLQIILAYGIQIYFCEEIPSVTSIIGTVLILLSIIFMSFEREVYGVCDFIP